MRCRGRLAPMRGLFTLYLIALSIVVFSPVNEDSGKLLGIFELSVFLERSLNLFLLLPMAYFLQKLSQSISLSKIVILCVAMSLSIEIIQRYIPGRVSDLIDVVMNSAGVTLFTLGQLLYLKYTEGESRKSGTNHQ